ncbi:MAG TPA: hypothetical protein VIV11_10900 [Kofleriaceae bacterium]
MIYLRLWILALVPACGLIDSDVTNFNLDLPDKQFSVDASGWQVNQMAADTFLNMSCSSSPSICSSAATQACPMNCSGRCGASSRCELELNISAYKGIDLVTEKPELKQIDDRPVISVEVDSVRYTVTANTLNVNTPEMGVYVAPITVMDPKDPMAKQIGIIEAVPAGATVAAKDMAYTPNGKQTLVDTMSSYKSPFNVIVGTSATNPIVITAGQPVPMGKLDAVIQIRAHAGL